MNQQKKTQNIQKKDNGIGANYSKAIRINTMEKQTQPKKTSWLKKIFFANPDQYDDNAHHEQRAKTAQATDQSIKVNQQVREVVSNLDKKIEQNNVALMHTLETLNSNNQALLQQVQSLSESNKLLYEKMLQSNKRARIFKIFALLASLTTISVGVWRFLEWFLNK